MQLNHTNSKAQCKFRDIFNTHIENFAHYMLVERGASQNTISSYKTDLKQYNISKNSSIPIIITKNWENYFKSPHNYHEDAVGKGIS